MRTGSSIRWAFHCRSWEPTEQEWLFAAQCIQSEEKQRIGKFAFKKDAKASMVGRLMIRKFAQLATGLPYEDIVLDRDSYGKPVVRNCGVPLDFNVSHQGHYTVFAGETGAPLQVGVDVMHLEHNKSGDQLAEFFRLMRRQMSEREWDTILSSPSDKKRSETFFRLWALKESYLKAAGIGLNLNLWNLSFCLCTPCLSKDKVCDDTTVQFEEVLQTGWKFHEWLLDSNHCVSVALHSTSGTLVDVEPIPFTTLNWSDLVSQAKPIIPPDVSYCQEFLKKDSAVDLCR